MWVGEEGGQENKTFNSPWWMTWRCFSSSLTCLFAHLNRHTCNVSYKRTMLSIVLLTKEEGWWCWWWWGGLTECAGLIIKQLFTALHGGSGPKCADAGKISKWCICTTRRISNVELMITLGWDRYCQKVTRRQGNGLLQACTVWQGGGGGRGVAEVDGKETGEDNHKGKKGHFFKAITHHFSFLRLWYKTVINICLFWIFFSLCTAAMAPV